MNTRFCCCIDRNTEPAAPPAVIRSDLQSSRTWYLLCFTFHIHLQEYVKFSTLFIVFPLYSVFGCCIDVEPLFEETHSVTFEFKFS